MTARSQRQDAPAFVDLPAVLASISDRAMLANPALSALVVEHSCWELHWNEWVRRQPSKRGREFTEWIGEGRALFDRRDELKALACALLRRG
jgi:hypothetical protein